MTYGADRAAGAAAPVPAGKRAVASQSLARLPTGLTAKPTKRTIAGELALTENEIQKAVFAHLRTRGAPGIFAFHPKNASADMAGRKSGIHVGLGVEPGIPDVIVFKGWAGSRPDWGVTDVFALELKRVSRKGRKMTAHECKQEATRRRLELCGVTVGVAYGLDEAIAWLWQHGLLIGRSA